MTVDDTCTHYIEEILYLRFALMDLHGSAHCSFNIVPLRFRGVKYLHRVGPSRYLNLTFFVENYRNIKCFETLEMCRTGQGEIGGEERLEMWRQEAASVGIASLMRRRVRTRHLHKRSILEVLLELQGVQGS